MAELIDQIIDQSEGSISGYFFKDSPPEVTESPLICTGRNRNTAIKVVLQNATGTTIVNLEVKMHPTDDWFVRAFLEMTPSDPIQTIEIYDFSYHSIRLTKTGTDGIITASVYST